MNENQFPMGERFRDAQLSQFQLCDEDSAKMLNWLKKPVGLLIFTGNPGVGKTHFTAAVYNYFKQSRSILYLKESAFFQRIRNVIGNIGGDYVYETTKMANYDLLFWILDDIGSSQMTEWQKEVLQLFVDELYLNKRAAIITSNIWVRDMGEVFSRRFQSRIAATQNTIIELNGDDKRQQGL